MMFILTYKNGDAAWFADLAAVLEHIEYDAYGLKDCGAYRIDQDGTWSDATRRIEEALIEHDEALAWERDHEAFISSPERTGRV
jgi:hypothetical protein